MIISYYLTYNRIIDELRMDIICMQILHHQLNLIPVYNDAYMNSIAKIN